MKLNKEFINEINPKYSIISVGKNNRYGHPNKEVLNNLEKSKIYRTDMDGSIMFKIKNYDFFSYLNDINNIILKYNKDNADSVLGLINNFEAYVDRKINKFKGISKMSLESEINALNSAFADDD